MKFAHEFQVRLKGEPYPEHWLQSVVPYAQLKKIIKKLTAELQSLGLDPATLRQLMRKPDEAPKLGRRGSSVEAHYELDGDRAEIRPRLTLLVQMEDGLIQDAKLSPETKDYLMRLVAQKAQHRMSSTERALSHENIEDEHGFDQIPSTSSSVQRPGPGIQRLVQRVEIPLTFDAEFFELLNGEVTGLEALQAKEQDALTREISALGKQVAALSKPSRFRKTDLKLWREVFELYLQANVFFSTNELDHGSRDSKQAAKQLNWFQREVVTREIPAKFKLSASRHALDRFGAVNGTLLQNMQFQEINQVAVGKILKKFEKRTQLGVAKTFPRFTHPDTSFSEGMGKAVCAQVSQELVSTIPQLDSHLCPVCYSVAWRPIRLSCNHVMCSGCTVELQKKRVAMCPLCRLKVVLQADVGNIDEKLSAYLKKYFWDEVVDKQMEHEIKAGLEDLGIFYKHPGRNNTAFRLMMGFV